MSFKQAFQFQVWHVPTNSNNKITIIFYYKNNSDNEVKRFKWSNSTIICNWKCFKDVYNKYYSISFDILSIYSDSNIQFCEKRFTSFVFWRNYTILWYNWFNLIIAITMLWISSIITKCSDEWIIDSYAVIWSFIKMPKYLQANFYSILLFDLYFIITLNICSLTQFPDLKKQTYNVTQPIVLKDSGFIHTTVTMTSLHTTTQHFRKFSISELPYVHYLMTISIVR